MEEITMLGLAGFLFGYSAKMKFGKNKDKNSAIKVGCGLAIIVIIIHLLLIGIL